MIVAIIALVFWLLSPELGIIMAVLLPSVIALDMDGSYSQVYVVVIFAVALYFVRSMRDKDTPDE